jgi:TolA-binding protein
MVIFVIEKSPALKSMIRVIIPLFLLFLFSAASAQTTLNREQQNSLFQEALALVNRNNYSAARLKFEEYIQNDPSSEMLAEARYYQAFSAMHLFHEDAEKLYENFVKDYPIHPKSMIAYFELGNFYYRNKDYDRAIESYEQVVANNLSVSQRSELRFKLGYSYFAEQKFDEALKNLNYSIENKNTYQGASAYYSAFIALENEQYEDALRFLDIAANYETYDRVVPFLKTKALYGQKKYNEVIAYARPLIVSGDPLSEKSSITIMVAESFYFLDDYRNAYTFYEEVIDPSGGNHSPELLFRAGLSAFQSGYFEQAVEYLKNAALAEGLTGQYASYYLGLSYIRTENKNYAITAFENAARKKFDTEITDESMFYLGKLYFETGRFANAIETLQPLNESSLAASHREELNELISEAYLNTDDVNMAIEYIESLDDRTPSVNRVYQIVTFKKAIQLFNAGSFYESVQMFERSLQHPQEKEVVLKSWFWMGEAYSIGKLYEDAIRSYLEVFRNDPSGRSETVLKARYGLGYAYFNTKSYENALTHFSVYVREIERSNQQLFYDDALLRLADCYYVTRNYREAISTYEKAIRAESPEPDYCYYQIGIIHSILGNRQVAEENLSRVIEQYGQSVYLDDALFQRSQVAFENGDYTTAINRYTHLIQNQAQSPYIPYALVDRAISYYNLKNYDASIKDYQQVLNEFPRHQEANDALLGLQEVLNLTNRSDQFNSFLAKYKAANPEDKALASVEFESAKSLYFNQQYDAAVQALRQYQSDYPDSPFKDDVNYYLGESFYRSDDYLAAINHLLPVARNDNSEWNGRAVYRVAMLYSLVGEHAKARDFYRKLERIATNRRSEFDAYSGLLEAYYELGKYDSAIYYGDQILRKGAFSVNAENRTQLLIGKSYLAQGNTENAVDYFLNTVNTAKDVHGAEAQYLIAEIFHEREEYQQSNEALFNLNENYGNYEEWIGRSFLLIAENFVAMDEVFQAKATLNSLIENSPVEPIVEEAKARLGKIEESEQKLPDEEEVPMEMDSIEIN